MARILVIDDEPSILALLCDLLEIEGYDATGIAHPDQVVGTGREQNPDLVLVDLTLPGMDGIALATRLRTSGYATTPMIAMSASLQMVHRADASGLFQASLVKPFDIEALLTGVATHLRAPLRYPGTGEVS